MEAYHKGLEKCNLIDNHNNRSEYSPGGKSTNGAIKSIFKNDMCIIQLIGVTMDHAGTWTVIPFTNTSQGIRHIFHIFFENVDIRINLTGMESSLLINKN